MYTYTHIMYHVMYIYTHMYISVYMIQEYLEPLGECPADNSRGPRKQGARRASANDLVSLNVPHLACGPSNVGLTGVKGGICRGFMGSLAEGYCI